MKKNIFVGIRGKILTGFFSLLFIFIINAIYNIYTITQSKSILKDLYEIKDPYLEVLKDFELMVIKSKMFTTNWVYLRKNEKDKAELKKILSEDFASIKEKLQAFESKNSSNSKDSSLHKILSDFESLKSKQMMIMSSLSSFESYEDPLVKFEAEETLESSVIPMSENILLNLSHIIKKNKEEKTAGRVNLSTSYDSLLKSILIIGLLISVFGIVASFIMSSKIVIPINNVKEIIEKLGNGEQPENVDVSSKDEVGEIAKAVKRLSIGLSNTSLFAENIGKGNLDAFFEPLSDKDILGNSLLEMRKNLKHFSEEEKKRNWATEGTAKFAELLRIETDLKKLSDSILSNLVKYVKANQGGIFIYNDTKLNDSFFELVSSFAYDRKKFIEKRIEIGEGLIGQCFLEKESILLTDIPEEYLSITSGLGSSNPRCILIVPIKLNEQIEGVLELASFEIFDSYQIEFIEKIAENLCSAIASAKVNQKTSQLLKESQMLTEQLRAQEEEMRQNVEELMATQEESQRKELEYIKKIELLEKANA